MNVEKIFKRTKIDFKKLEDYGFVKVNNNYEYSVVFMNSFRVDITIDLYGKITSQIFDIESSSYYTNHLVESMNGSFVNEVRFKYETILKDIRDNCFDKLYFNGEQSNRIAEKIIEIFHDEAVYPWEDNPGFGVFKNSNNKWYGLIMNIDINKLDKNRHGEVEAINVKLDPLVIVDLLKKDGYYPAYHMNKKHWITILLDDTLSDNEILESIIASYEIIKK